MENISEGMGSDMRSRTCPNFGTFKSEPHIRRSFQVAYWIYKSGAQGEVKAGT